MFLCFTVMLRSCWMSWWAKMPVKFWTLEEWEFRCFVEMHDFYWEPALIRKVHPFMKNPSFWSLPWKIATVLLSEMKSISKCHVEGSNDGTRSHSRLRVRWRYSFSLAKDTSMMKSWIEEWAATIFGEGRRTRRFLGSLINRDFIA